MRNIRIIAKREIVGYFITPLAYIFIVIFLPLIGAFTFLLWRRLATLGSNQTRAFTLIAVLMGLQLLFGLFFGLHSDWLADLGGFVCGFLLSFLLVPGGWARVLARLRQE